MTTHLCTNCGERPADPSSGTVPLCSVCQSLAKGRERGVKLAPKKTKSKRLSAVR